MFEVGLIRVITLDDPKQLNMHGKVIEQLYPDIAVESACIPNQPEGIHSAELCREAIPKIVELACERFAHKDMILVSCADDPAVEEIKAALPGMPVTGGGECCVATALRYGQNIGVLGIIDQAPKAYRRILEGRLVGNYRPEGVHSTLDLQTDQGYEACIETARRMAADGCDVIALGCTGLATVGIASELEQVSGLPVIDPVVAMGAFVALEAARKTVRNTR
ncbi:aspartate/glutamate racemase family protein [Adlercreutzia agrestimuris]|uniref:aspartate/glutamate racemase family protein n=1 Tax=Adlercreutzia agrestimuris TaxID=2941324 RepID=UPI00203EDAAE|nr:aspartate/glutamate racemase family protein [Adlercreutzia agrestimuris]